MLSDYCAVSITPDVKCIYTVCGASKIRTIKDFWWYYCVACGKKFATIITVNIDLLITT